MNKKLEQLALAKQAGMKAMAKNFFAPVPGGEEEPDGDEGGGEMGDGGPSDALTPEKLEELLRLLGHAGGGQ